MLAASLLVFSAAYAYSGTVGRMSVTIPFAFTAGNVLFPAGDYTISETLMEDNLLIQNRQERVASFLSTFHGQTSKNGDIAVRFNRYGDKYFLSQVSFGLAGSTSGLLVSKLERDFVGAGLSAAHISGK